MSAPGVEPRTVTITQAAAQRTDLTATISFASTAQRTQYSTTVQVWAADGVTFTNDKGASTASVGDYSGPARFYKNSKIKVEMPDKSISRIDFSCSSSSYASTLSSSVTDPSVTVTSDGKIVSVNMAGKKSRFVIDALVGVVWMDYLTVTYTNDVPTDDTPEIEEPAGMQPSVTLSTAGATLSGSTGLVLSGTFADASALPSEFGFYWGTSPTSMTGKVVSGSKPSETSGSFDAVLTGLTPGVVYYYKAYAVVYGTGIYASQSQVAEATDIKFVRVPGGADGVGGWLESVALTGNEDFVGTFYAGGARNYSYHYDRSAYTQMWVAYPLYSAAMGSLSRDDSWVYNPQISATGDGQVNLTGGNSYGVKYGSGTNYYARGHMIPNASRNGNAAMQEQTFYVTNSVPQVQNHFNSGMWSSLEGAMQTIARQTDTLYVVTGVAFRKQGGSEEITYISPGADKDKRVPVPNYFYKIALKVKRDAGVVTSASSVGIWLENREYDESDYAAYAVSVDQIEQWTGLNFFVNLPDGLETPAETNSDWSAFAEF